MSKSRGQDTHLQPLSSRAAEVAILDHITIALYYWFSEVYEVDLRTQNWPKMLRNKLRYYIRAASISFNAVECGELNCKLKTSQLLFPSKMTYFGHNWKCNVLVEPQFCSLFWKQNCGFNHNHQSATD